MKRHAVRIDFTKAEFGVEWGPEFTLVNKIGNSF